MNKERRKLIVLAGELLNKARDLLEQVRDAEGEAFENMPDGLKESERGCAIEGGLDTLSETIDTLENIDLSNL